MDAANLDEDENPRKSAALELVRRGFALLAVKAEEKRPDPLLAPDGFKSASHDAGTVGGWFDAKPMANVGIACGAEYGMVVLDVDIKNGAHGAATLRDLWIDTPTLTADTPSAGYHLYFKHPGVPLIAGLDGIDIKGAAGGGYVVCPPSTLPSGAYRWRDPEIPVADFPVHLLEELRADKKPSHPPAADNPAAALTVPQGKRHKRLVDLGAVYRAKGLEASEITWLLWEHATRYFDPPFSRDNADHVREIEDVAHWYEGKAAGSSADTVALHCGAGIAPEPIDWLWPGWLAAKKLHVLAGVPGTGKTTIALALAAAVSCGDRWPDGTPGCAPGHVLHWSGEDDLADTLVPRLLAMGADLSRIHFVGTVTGAEGARPFDPARDMSVLAGVARSIAGNVLLLIVDPIVNAVVGDSHKNVEVRRSLQPLVDFGRDLGAAVLGVSHFSKGTAGKDPLDRITGSLAFGALARLVFGAAKKTDQDGREASRVFVRIKSNIGPDGDGFEYQLEMAQLPQGIWTTQVTWGKAIVGDARHILGDAEQTEEDYEERSALEDAKTFLRTVLASGPMPTSAVLKEARQAGHSEKTVQRAKKSLGVRAVKGGIEGGWTWESPKVAKNPTTKTLATLGAFEDGQSSQSLAAFEDGQGMGGLATFEDGQDGQDGQRFRLGEVDHLRDNGGST